MFDTITIDTDARGVATLTLNRPDKRNALSLELLQELSALLTTISQNNDIRVLIIKGTFWGHSIWNFGDVLD